MLLEIKLLLIAGLSADLERTKLGGQDQTESNLDLK